MVRHPGKKATCRQAQMRGTLPQGTPRVAGNPQKLEEAREHSSLRPSDTFRCPVGTLVWGSWPPEPGENKFLLFRIKFVVNCCISPRKLIKNAIPRIQ